MVDREVVEWAYRLLLGREPEPGAPIDSYMALPDLSAVRSRFMDSVEFQVGHSRHPTPNAWVWAETADFLLRVNLADAAISWAVINGDFETAETRFVTKNVRDGAVVADIGANVGYFTMLFARLVGDGGQVFAFEPHPHLFESLQRSILMNEFEGRVKAFNVALADRDGVAQLLYAPETSNWGGSCLTFDEVAPPGHHSRTVPIRRFASLMTAQALDFVKIDVEGAEPLVLSAGVDAIKRFRPVILSEIHADQLRRVSNSSAEDYVRLVTELGYQCRILSKDGELNREITASDLGQVINVAFTPV